MTIESDELSILRDTTRKLLLGLLWLHVPRALAIRMMRVMHCLMSGRVVGKGVILVREAGGVIGLGDRLALLFETTARKTAEAERAHEAEARATNERSESERRAKQDRDAARRELAAGFERKIGGIVEA